MGRLTAFSFLVLTAFAWTPPFLDRAGTAALGFAFLALAVGRAARATRPSTLDYARRVIGPAAASAEPVMRETDELLAAYLADEK